VARRSTRNLLRMFQAADVDDQSIGPDVSEDIQLVYVVDDVSESTVTWAGTGGNEGAVVGEHGILRIECRNLRGLMIDGFDAHQVPAFGNEATIHVWISAAAPTITGPAGPLIALQSGPPAEASPIIGTITTANIASGAYRKLSLQSGVWEPFFVANTRFFNIAYGTANVAVDLGIRWRELSRS